MTALRVLTWNTWWCFGPWRERQPLLVAAVAARRPDVVLLQETWPDQARAVAEAAGLAVIAEAVGPFTPLGADGAPADNRFGNALLARPEEAEAMGSVPLASRDDGAPRNGVALRWHGSTDTGTAGGTGREVLVVATHLNHIAAASDVRLAQLGTLGRWLASIRPDGPVIMGGDLNLTPYSPEYRQGITPAWVDLWPTTRPDDPGSTMVPANPRFRDVDWMADRNGPGAPPGVRFDYLLARRGPDGRPGLRVAAIDVVGAEADGWPSDHLGLVADVELGEGTRPT